MTSPGRAAAILLNLRMIGFVVRDPAQRSRRERRYLPSPETIAVFRMSFRNEVLAFSLIEPSAARLADRFDEPKVFRAYVLTLGHDLTNLVKGKNGNDAISLFAGAQQRPRRPEQDRDVGRGWRRRYPAAAAGERVGDRAGEEEVQGVALACAEAAAAMRKRRA